MDCLCECRQLLHRCVQAVIDAGVKLPAVLTDCYKQCLQSLNSECFSAAVTDRLVTLGFSLGNGVILILHDLQATLLCAFPFATLQCTMLECLPLQTCNWPIVASYFKKVVGDMSTCGLCQGRGEVTSWTSFRT